MTHVDLDSLKNFSACFLLSAAGGYGVAAAIGAAVAKEWYDKKELRSLVFARYSV